ncbi:hypothetical protein KKG58_01990 [Patescibacteria group bacterium]|nr:hypothetical protein [Patescibacteria group bacterium]
MKKIILIVFLTLIINLVPKPVSAETVELYFFHGQGCPVCSQAQIFLGKLSAEYLDIKIKSFEVFYNQTNKDVYIRLGQAYNLDLEEIPVPVILIGEKSFIGYNQAIATNIKQTAIKCLSQECVSPIEKLEHTHLTRSSPTNYESKRITNKLFVWAIIILLALGLIFLFKKRKT